MWRSATAFASVVGQIHAVWFIRDGFISDAFQRLLDLLEILRDEV